MRVSRRVLTFAAVVEETVCHTVVVSRLRQYKNFIILLKYRWTLKLCRHFSGHTEAVSFCLSFLVEVNIEEVN